MFSNVAIDNTLEMECCQDSSKSIADSFGLEQELVRIKETEFLKTQPEGAFQF